MTRSAPHHLLWWLNTLISQGNYPQWPSGLGVLGDPGASGQCAGPRAGCGVDKCWAANAVLDARSRRTRAASARLTRCSARAGGGDTRPARLRLTSVPVLPHLPAVRCAARSSRRVLLIAAGLGILVAASARAAELDWRRLGDETAELLADVLRIDTTNPPGSETAAANAFARKLVAEGLRVEVIESSPGRGSLYARLPGRGAGRGRQRRVLHQRRRPHPPAGRRSQDRPRGRRGEDAFLGEARRPWRGRPRLDAAVRDGGHAPHPRAQQDPPLPHADPRGATGRGLLRRPGTPGEGAPPHQARASRRLAR